MVNHTWYTKIKQKLVRESYMKLEKINTLIRYDNCTLRGLAINYK